MAIGMLVWGFLLLGRRLWVFAFGQRVEGVLVDWQRRGRRGFHPVVEYKSAAGEVRRVTGLGGHESAAEGETFQVIYLENKPSMAFVYSFFHFWAAPIVIIAKGAVPAWDIFFAIEDGQQQD